MSNMVVRTNMLALNSHRNLGMVGAAQARASARLSSGFRINSGADDAAGLGISENMRAQIRGLDMASRNAQDGISLVQTAEGGLSTINDMIIRIRELTVQAGNDINTSEGHVGIGTNESNRARIQGEINHLIDEIQRTATTLQFNGMTLLDGSFTPGALAPLTDAERMSITSFLATYNPQVTAFNDARVNLGIAEQNLANLQANRAFLLGVQTEINDRTSVAYINAFLDQAVLDWGQYVADNNLGAAQTTDAAQTAWLNNRINIAFGLSPVTAVVTADTAISLLDHGHANFDVSVLQNAMVASRVSPGDIATVTAIAAGGNPAIPAAGGFPAVNASPNVVIDAHTVPTDWATLGAAVGAAGSAGTTQIDNAEANVLANTTYVNDIHDALTTAMRVNVPLLQDGIMFDTFDNMMAAFNADPAGRALWLQIGANSLQGIEVEMPDVVTAIAGALRLTFGSPEFGQVSNDSSVGSVAEFRGQDISALLDEVDEVLAIATAARGALGAIENRLEFTIRNLDVSSENLSAANSRIRDADMALEMMRLTQANVLQQAATAMLAQGNQAPQSILQLLG